MLRLPTSFLIAPISRRCRLPPRPVTVVVQCLESCPEQSVFPHPPPICAPLVPTHRLTDPGFPPHVERLRLAASTFQPAMACLSSSEDHTLTRSVHFRYRCACGSALKPVSSRIPAPDESPASTSLPTPAELNLLTKGTSLRQPP